MLALISLKEGVERKITKFIDQMDKSANDSVANIIDIEIPVEIFNTIGFINLLSTCCEGK
jgi:hypothetical protein